MPYLNIDLDFPEHRKTKRLVSILGRGSEAMLLRLWCYLARHHPEDGRLSDYSPEEIESLAGWVGKPGRMIEVMRLVGWLGRDTKGWFVTNWLEHQGHIAAFKAKGKAMAEARWQKVRDATSNAACNAASNARSVPIRTERSESGSNEPSAQRSCPTTPSAPPTQVLEKNHEPTNKPTIEQALAYFRKHAGCFREEEIRECYRTFQASQANGFWYWGKRLVGDWRASMEQRMLEYRERRGGKKPPQTAGAALSRAIERAAKV